MTRITQQLILLSLLVFLGFQTYAVTLPALSENSQVILFTCKPGSELYAGFGHDALWISDPENGVDRLYNYGTFDFNTPHFYVKFVRGKLNYMLSITTIQRFINEYDYRKIGVYGQTLNLNLQEKQKLFTILEDTYNSDARYYKYDFFFDNCATRLRDVVIACTDDEIDFNTPSRGITFNDMLFGYLEHTPWTKMGINLILGLPADKTASTFEYMFLPEYMQEQFDNAIVNRKGDVQKLVSKGRVFLQHRIELSRNSFFDPLIVFSLILLVLGFVSMLELRLNKHFLWIDILLNVLGVIAGAFLFFMWVGTDHIATNYNLNSLWLLPAQVVFLFSLGQKNDRKHLLVKVSFITIIAIAFAMLVWPQATEGAFIVICLIFALRYLVQLKRKV